MPPKKLKAVHAKKAANNVASSSSAGAALKVKLVTELGPDDVLMGRGAYVPYHTTR